MPTTPTPDGQTGSDPMQLELIADYLVPVDPMDALECESCQ